MNEAMVDVFQNMFAICSDIPLYYQANVTVVTLQPLEVVSRYRDPQLQVQKNTHFVPNKGNNVVKTVG